MGAGIDRPDGESAQNIWFLGSSHLMVSIIPRFCSAEIQERCAADWQARRTTEGQLRLDSGRAASFLSCNMVTLGDPEYVSGEVRCEPGLVQFLDMIEPGAKVIVSLLRGNEFVYDSLIDEPPRWDFSYGRRLADPARIFVQRTDVMAHADGILAPLFATLIAIRSRFPEAAVYQVAPPPPLEHGSPHLDPEKLRAANMGEAADLADEYGVRPFHVRKKIYDAMYERLAARLSPVGVQVFFAPAECLTPEGALMSAFASDCMHGNDLYGRALLREIEEKHLHAPL
jgi:hypothetical protein